MRAPTIFAAATDGHVGIGLLLGLTFVIELGGKRELRTRAADEQIGAAEAAVLDTLRGQVFQLRQAFIQGLAARANLDVALANRASLDRTEALLRRQVDGPGPDRHLAPEIAAAVRLAKSGAIVAAAEEAVGPLA